MPSSNQGGQLGGGPVRTPGRNFLSSDPERQREVAGNVARPRDERQSAHATQARPPRSSVNVTRAPARGTLEWDSDDEGGSGRRSR